MLVIGTYSQINLEFVGSWNLVGWHLLVQCQLKMFSKRYSYIIIGMFFVCLFVVGFKSNVPIIAKLGSK